MQNNKIFDELDNLIKKAKAQKQATLGKESEDASSKLDSADDGESPATTGEQAAHQIKAQKEQYADPAADVNASENATGESVGMSSDEAAAASPTGQEGAQGGELSSGGVGSADNGDEETDTPKNNGWDSGAFKSAADDLRKQAAELRKMAEESLSPLDRFLAKAARASDDEELKKQAQSMDDGELAEAAAESLMGQLESGALSDEEAAGILQEAMGEGAVSPEELDMAAQSVGAVPGGDMAEAKLAAAEIGPDHPEYLKKLASFYPTEIQAGYAFGKKLAEEMLEDEDSYDEDSYEGDDKKDKSYDKKDKSYDKKDKSYDKKDKSYDKKDKSYDKKDKSYDKKGKGKKEARGDESYEEDMSYEDEKKERPPEEEAPPEEEGLPEDGKPAPEEGEYGDEMSEEAEMEGALEEELAPADPEEEAALNAVGGELGLDPAALDQLMAAPVPPEAEAEIAKMAKVLKTAGISPEHRYRTLVLQKVAALKA